MFWPLRSSPQTCPRLVIWCKATVLNLQNSLSCCFFWVWRLCAYGVDFNPTLDPWLQSSARFDIFISGSQQRTNGALQPASYVFPPHSTFLFSALPSVSAGGGGAYVRVSGSRLFCLQRTEWLDSCKSLFPIRQHGGKASTCWNAARSSRSAQPCASHFISERDTVSWAFSDCSQALVFSRFFLQGFFPISWPEISQFASCLWIVFFPLLYAQFSFVPFEQGGLKPSTHMHMSTHTR